MGWQREKGETVYRKGGVYVMEKGRERGARKTGLVDAVTRTGRVAR
jgi:hypothetical protein